MSGNTSSPTVNLSAPEIDPSSIGIDDIGHESDTTMTKFETYKPTTFVEVDPSGDLSTAEYVTVDQYGNELPGFPNPKAAISSIDMNLGDAVNEISQRFEIKVRDTSSIIDGDTV